MSANGSTKAWRQLRAQMLAADPTCELCRREPADQVDHIVQLRDWPDGRYVWTNLRSVCGPCHKARHGKRAKPRKRLLLGDQERFVY